jgi:hypothetical protein
MVQMFIDASETSKNPNLIHAVGVRLSGSAIVDTVIAASMTYFVSSLVVTLTRLVELTPPLSWFAAGNRL